jgi:hypothetical protein
MAASRPYSADPWCAVAAEISRLDASSAIVLDVTTGTAATSAGQSHSCVRPTRSAVRPSAATMSVAAGSSDTILMPRTFP